METPMVLSKCFYSSFYSFYETSKTTYHYFRRISDLLPGRLYIGPTAICGAILYDKLKPLSQNNLTKSLISTISLSHNLFQIYHGQWIKGFIGLIFNALLLSYETGYTTDQIKEKLDKIPPSFYWILQISQFTPLDYFTPFQALCCYEILTAKQEPAITQPKDEDILQTLKYLHQMTKNTPSKCIHNLIDRVFYINFNQIMTSSQKSLAQDDEEDLELLSLKDLSPQEQINNFIILTTYKEVLEHTRYNLQYNSIQSIFSASFFIEQFLLMVLDRIDLYSELNEEYLFKNTPTAQLLLSLYFGIGQTGKTETYSDSVNRSLFNYCFSDFYKQFTISSILKNVFESFCETENNQHPFSNSDYLVSLLPSQNPIESYDFLFRKNSQRTTPSYLGLVFIAWKHNFIQPYKRNIKKADR